VAEGVTSGLQVDAQPVRTLSHLDASQQMAAGGINGIDLAIIAPRHPQYFAVGGDTPHIGAASSGKPPSRDPAALGKTEKGSTSPPVEDIQYARIAVGV